MRYRMWPQDSSSIQISLITFTPNLQYIPRNLHTVTALLCFVVVIHWLIFPYPSGLLHWHCGNLTIAPVLAKQPWWIWINTSCEFIMNNCITTTKQSTTKPCAYFLGYTVSLRWPIIWQQTKQSGVHEASLCALFALDILWSGTKSTFVLMLSTWCVFHIFVCDLCVHQLRSYI